MSGAQSLVIVGGGPGGLAAARAYRDQGGDGEVTLLTGEADAPYLRPSLSKEFLRGEAEIAEIALEKNGWYEEHDVKLRLESPVEALDTATRTVALAGGETVGYDACVLATGAEPAPLPVPGADDASVKTLRSLEDARALRADADDAYSAIVVGSGFIGCETAASLAMRGLRVTLISDEHVPHAARLGVEAGHKIAHWLVEHGVALRLGASIEAIEPGLVRVPGKEPVLADMVLLAGGCRPRSALAEAAGLDLTEGRVTTDEQMRTSAEGVYAVGDLALARNATAGRALKVEHWGEALNHGEIAGTTAAGGDAAWDAAPGFWSTIGTRTLKHVAWGDGFDEARLVDHRGGAFTVWYGSEGTAVGVLTHGCDDDYERGRELIEAEQPLP